MADYFFDEGAMDLPGTWTDRTVHVLEAPASTGGKHGLMVTREALAPGADFTSVVEDRLAQLPRALRGYKLIGRRESVVGGLPAVEIKLSWKSPEGMMFHHLAYVGLYSSVLTFTASCRAALEDDCEAVMAGVLASVRFRER